MSQFFETFRAPHLPGDLSTRSRNRLGSGRLLGHPWIGVLLSSAIMCVAFTWMLQGWFPAHWALVGAVLVLLRPFLMSYWVDTYGEGRSWPQAPRWYLDLIAISYITTVHSSLHPGRKAQSSRAT